ncbi:2-hydroxychromene-2-carboxylate isomerase [Hyphomonas sp.]|uniref:2-hydroxychromene-2-carboxylate isomerase n=1 Tax=Hyphomonas sp. TaxID=87 RepID=UPI0035298BDD
MSKNVDVFWSFRSPYSYLITPDLLRLREDFDVTVKLRPVLPIALRARATVFDANDKKRPRYIVMDARRRAEFLGLPFKWPNPDPVIQDRETFEVSSEQPLIWRLTGLGIEAERRGKGIDFARSVSALLWSGITDWDKSEHLAIATEKAGLDLAELEASISAGAVRDDVERNHEALEAAGHWGVPTMVFEGEPFFGQDRIETLRWRLDRTGLRKTSVAYKA